MTREGFRFKDSAGFLFWEFQLKGDTRTFFFFGLNIRILKEFMWSNTLKLAKWVCVCSNPYETSRTPQLYQQEIGF